MAQTEDGLVLILSREFAFPNMPRQTKNLPQCRFGMAIALLMIKDF